MRGLVVLGAAVVLVGSYAVTSADSVSPPVVMPVQVVPAGETHAQWAARAERVLASVNEQLDLIADTEVAVGWAVASGASAPAAPVEALKERKVLLLQRQVSLRSQLESYRSLQETRRQLVLVEQRLAAIEVALSGAPPIGKRTPEQGVEIMTLLGQRDLLISQRDARLQEVLRLEQALTAAVRTPLAADERHTALVSGLILDALAGRRAPGAPETPRAGRPQVIDNRGGNLLARVRYDVPNGAPPDPRGPRTGRGGVVRRLGDVPGTIRSAPLPQPQPLPLPSLPRPALPRQPAPLRESGPFFGGGSGPFFGGGMGDTIAHPLIENIPGAKERFGGSGDRRDAPPDPDGTSLRREDADDEEGENVAPPRIEVPDRWKERIPDGRGDRHDEHERDSERNRRNSHADHSDGGNRRDRDGGTHDGGTHDGDTHDGDTHDDDGVTQDAHDGEEHETGGGDSAETSSGHTDD